MPVSSVQSQLKICSRKENTFCSCVCLIFAAPPERDSGFVKSNSHLLRRVLSMIGSSCDPDEYDSDDYDDDDDDDMFNPACLAFFIA